MTRKEPDMPPSHPPHVDTPTSLWRRLHLLLRSNGMQPARHRSRVDLERTDLGYEAAYALPPPSTDDLDRSHPPVQPRADRLP
jgi:hypothetical protein